MPQADLPLPDNVRRYYIASTTHGGGAGGFDTSLPGVGPADEPVGLPGQQLRHRRAAANPMPHTRDGQRAARALSQLGDARHAAARPAAIRRWRDGQLVAANKAAHGLSDDARPARRRVPEADFIMPVLDYDWGREFKPSDGSGVPRNAPPPIKQVLQDVRAQSRCRRQRARRRAGGAARRAARAPISAGTSPPAATRPFHRARSATTSAAWCRSRRTAAERVAPAIRGLSLEERYGEHEGYVAAVRKAAARAVAEGFLLREDAADLVSLAEASHVLR